MITDEQYESIRKLNKEGKIVYEEMPGEVLACPVDKFIQQPVEGILYDLNRLEEVTMAINDNYVINNLAVAYLIRYLIAELNKYKEKEQNDERNPGES